MGQVVSEIGDHFNTIAVLSLALRISGSGATVGGVMIARTLPALLAAPIAGVFLDRMDRKRLMILSDVVRAVVAALFLISVRYPAEWLLFLLSACLMFASPFFTSGRSAILPKLTTREELHTANALTQTTAWLTISFGAMLGGLSTTQFGFEWAFVANTFSFVFSTFCIAKLRSPDGHFRAARREVEEHQTHRAHFWQEIGDAVGYVRQTPLVFAILLTGVGWATGGGAAQILFTLFGEVVYKGGPAAVGLIWGFAGIGLVIGGLVGHQLLRRLTYRQYLHAVWLNFLVHGLSYAAFALGNLANAVFFITLSRLAMGANNVQNRTMLLHHVPDQFRGRVFTAAEALTNGTMMISMTLASLAVMRYSPRVVAFAAGLLSASTALFWAWAVFTKRLPEPALRPAEEEDAASPVTPA
jgi:MFS family permease